MQKDKIAVYKTQDKVFEFANESRIVLGYCDTETDVLQYQGQAYEAIFIEEATHFTEFQFNCLKESNRLSGQCKKQIKPRIYLTCNPGGVGHSWVKRLFIDKDYNEGEIAEEYNFIPALVFENEYIMKNDPDYVKALESLPEDRKRAMLYGELLTHNPKDPAWINRDRFVLSGGHGSMLLYSALHLSGYDVSLDDIKDFRQLGSKCAGHPEYGVTPGVDATTGPLGQGIAMAVGMAMAETMLAEKFNTKNHKIVDHYTYVLLGEGCLMEGVSSEASSLAVHLPYGSRL